MQGQFVRGNKTAGEFNTTMAMAGDRLLSSAIFIDDQFFSPLRTILLSDTLQYQADIQVFDKEAGQFIQTIQKRQGQAVCCPEEIAFHQGWISRSDLLDQAKSLSKNEYGEYLKDIASE